MLFLCYFHNVVVLHKTENAALDPRCDKLTIRKPKPVDTYGNEVKIVVQYEAAQLINQCTIFSINLTESEVI